MTVIQLMTADQLLTATQTPKVSAGDVQTVKIQVDFDDLWDGFAKSAVFHTDKKPEIYEVLLDNEDTCIVPAEVLADECSMFIGVRGVNGAMVKTSTLVKYKICVGAQAGDSTVIEPTPDVYQQILAAYSNVKATAESAEGTAESAANNAASALSVAQNTANNAMLKSGGTFTGSTTHNAATHFNASTYMQNGVYYNAYDADGSACTILGISGNGNLQLGTNNNAHSGNTTVLAKNGYSIITSGGFNAYITVNDTAYGADAHQVLKWGRLSASNTEESSHLRCAVTDASYLGTPSYKWAALYAKNGAIQTSDRNLKKNIKEMDDKYIQLFDLIRPVSYQMIDGDRIHTGFIAQEVEDAMLEVGLTAEDLGFFCRDIKTAIVDEDVGEVPVLDADGNPEYTYSLRYEEYIAIMAEKVRRLEAKYNEKIEQLEARLASLDCKEVET